MAGLRAIWSSVAKGKRAGERLAQRGARAHDLEAARDQGREERGGQRERGIERIEQRAAVGETGTR